MANLIEISDPLDLRLHDYQSLRDVQLRQAFETENGLFLAEGEKVLRRAVEADFQPRSFMLAKRWLPGLEDILARSEAPCYVVSEEVAEAVTGFHVHRGALASLHRKPLLSTDAVVARARNLIVCEDIVDHTNVGAIFRSAAALGIDGVLLSPRCADPLYRRAVKVAMGAVFSLPWTRLNSWRDAMQSIENLGFTTVAMTLASDSLPLEEAIAGLDRVALVVGTEGHGLSDHWTATASRRAGIEMNAGIDSLNVAAATAVAAYALRRR